MSRINRVFSTLRRSPYQSLSAVFVTSITFFVISVFTLITLGSHSLLRYFESRPQVTAFFKDNTEEVAVNSLKDQITSTVPIASSRFVSQNEALEIYKAQNKNNPLLLEMVTADILPSSLEISTQNVSDLESVARIMQESTIVEEVVFQQDIIATLSKWLIGIRVVGISLISLLLSVTLITILLIISFKFRSKKSELYTLSLLGASSWYIRKPFITEALFYCSFGVIVGWGVTYLALLYLTPNLISFFGGILSIPVPPLVMGVILAGELFLGVFFAIIASLLGTHRLSR